MEADDRLLFYVSHAVEVESFEKVIIAGADTDIFKSTLYCFKQ